MAKVIPTSADSAFYNQRTQLDGKDYTLRFSWNQREGRWYLSLLDESDDPIISSIKVLANWPMLRNHRHDDRVPPGELVAFDLTGDNSPPGFDELGIGARCELTYFTVDEVDALG